MKKKALRKTFFAKRDQLSSSQITEFSKLIGGQLLAGFEFSKVNYLHHFVSLKSKNEVDTEMIASRIVSSYPSVKPIVPRVNKISCKLEHLEVGDQTEFERGEWGIPEPVGEKLIDEKLIDFVIVPLLCFDRRGHRVGYGGGYYDRFLAKCRPGCLKVGVSFFGPAEDIEDVHDGDIRLDYCATPDEIYDFSLTIDH